MAFYKICTCGEKIVFEGRLSFPDNCPSCGRRMVDFMTYDEDNSPIMKESMNEENEIEGYQTEEKSATIEGKTERTYCLRLNNGNEISIPAEGGVVGRTGVGAEELAPFSSVSRQHLRIILRRNVGVLIEDISSYGTLVNGQRIEKNTPIKVAVGTKITLCDLEAILMLKEGGDL